MKPTTTPTIDRADTIDIPQYDPLLTTEQLARFLKCSPSYIEKLRAAGSTLPVVRVGKLCRYKFSDVMDFVERNRHTKAV